VTLVANKKIPSDVFRPGTLQLDLLKSLGSAGGPLTTAQVAKDLGTSVPGAGRALGHWAKHDSLVERTTGPFGVPAWRLTRAAQEFYDSL